MKFCSILIALLIFSNLNPVSVNIDNISDSITYNDMSFEVKAENPNELILIEYNGTAETLVVPESIGAYTVTAIGDEVFKDNAVVKNIELPDTINYFGREVFRNSAIVSVNIPKSLVVIPSYSFNNCSELETVIFHDNIAFINYTAFKKTDIEIPEELNEHIIVQLIKTSNFQFYNSSNSDWLYIITSEYGNTDVCLAEYKGNSTDIVAPDYIMGIPVTTINCGKIESDTPIKSAYFPKTITKFSASFSGSEIEEITLPDINTIPAYAFTNCANLKTINFQSNPESFTIGKNAFKNCNIDFIPCPESCSNITIEDSAFENTPIKEVKIDFDSFIGAEAFRNCSALSYVELHSTNVKSRAFMDCSALEDVTITGDSVLEEMSFYNCEYLKNISLSDLNISMVNAVYNCPEFMTINNRNAFDSTTDDFDKEMKEFIFNNFSGVDEVGFVNLYIQAQADKITDEITSDNMSDVQKIKAIHDWICKNTVYDDGLSGDRKNHNDASVLMNDSTVCEGYARIANILYNSAGIESYYISGISHAWNIVKAGNNYFHIDTTWDDGEEISYDWFMKSDDEMRESGGNHAEWKTYIPSSLHSFQEGKVLPECKYSMGDVNQDNSINVADLVTLNKFILNISTGDNIDYILADLTFDGLVDSFDLVKMRQIIVSQLSNN
ncbi:MAG: leucine-rich repeat protein [Ruminococcus flavefaciens]|nr:leucine-rich repeat protein [Ruminococcus flavefaciens]